MGPCPLVPPGLPLSYCQYTQWALDFSFQIFRKSKICHIDSTLIPNQTPDQDKRMKKKKSSFSTWAGMWSLVLTEDVLLGAFTLLTSRFLKSQILYNIPIYSTDKTTHASVAWSSRRLRDFWVGSAHVRSQATVHAFMHAVCMRAEDIDTRFKERA